MIPKRRPAGVSSARKPRASGDDPQQFKIPAGKVW